MFKRFTSMLLAIIMIIGVFPVSVLAEETSSEEILPVAQRISIEEEFADYFYKATNQTGDYVEFDCVIEGNERAVFETFGGTDALMLFIEAPSSEFSEVKEIWWEDFDATDEYRDIETGELVFDGMLCWFAFVDENGNLINTCRQFKIVWENAKGETYTDEVTVAYYFPQIPEMPESTPVADQKLTVWYVEGSTYKRILAEEDIIDGEVEVTIPYITDEEVKAIEADSAGRKRARLAFCISDGYDDENITHFMGGFGNNIMDYVNWEEWAKDYDDFSDFLFEQYWEIDQFGVESVVKYEVARDTNGEMRRWIEPGETFSERLYIQYFDAENKEAVAYEHMDVTLNMEDVFPDEAEQMSFGQVKLNGYELNSEEIGYDIGVNGDTNELIVEMSMGQLWAKENTKDGYGNIYNIFEFSAPAEGNYKYIKAVGAEEIAEIKNLDAKDFENEYDPENKPEISFVLGWFEDGEFYQTFEGEKKTSVCFAWYDGTNITYQSFKLCQWMPIHEDDDNQGGNEDGPQRYLPDRFWDYWTEDEFVAAENVEVVAHDAIRNYLDVEYNEEGVLVITVNDIPAEDWKKAYSDLAAGEDEINVGFKITPQYDNIVEYADNQGNGPTYENLKNRYDENPDQIEYQNCDGPVYAGIPVGTVAVDGAKVSVFPTRSGGVFYKVIFWKDASGNIIQQIFPFVVEVSDDAKNVSFANEKEFIPEERVVKDGRTSLLSGNYDSEKGILKYSYIGTKTSDADIADDIKFGYGENDPVHAIQTIILPPEEGYKTADGEEVSVINLRYDSPEYPLRGSRQSFDLEWVCEGKKTIRETITVEFNVDKVWMDKYWAPVIDSERIIYYSITNGYELMSSKEVREAGVILELFNKPGKIYTRYDDIDKVDIEKIANLEAWILPPDAVERNADESLDAWIERVYRETEYVGTKVGATGVGEYEPESADRTNQFMRSMSMLDIGTGSEAENIAGFSELVVNGIKVWFSSGMDRNGHTVLIDWYKEGEEEPSVREYIYNEQESLVVEQKRDSVTEEELKETGSVEVPTPVLGENDANWKLTTNHYPQTKENENVNAFYFQLEGDENTPEGDKVVYLPYSFIDPELDYDKAVEMKLKPKIHHYTDDHSELVEGKPIDGELCPEGIRFVVDSFSPFVLDWSENGEVANSGTGKHPETVVFEVPEALRNYIETSYDPENGILTVNVGEVPVEAWQAAYENIGVEDTAIGGDVIITAPEGTVKERRIMGGIDFDEFVEWTADPDSPLFNEIDPEWPYSYSFGEFAHINRTNGEVIITPEEEDFDVAVAWQDEDKNIVRQIIHIDMNIVEGSVKFDDLFANVENVDVSRIDFMGGDSELFSPYKSENVLNYEDGLLTFTYIGEGETPEEIREDILSESENDYAAMEITVLSPKENYYLVKTESQRKQRTYDVSEELTNANLHSEFKDFGDFAIEVEKYNIYWQNSEAPYDKIVETVSITYDIGFEIRWMDKYWDPVDYSETETNRINMVAQKDGKYQVISNSEVKNAGINIEWDNGHFNITYDKNVDIEIAKELIAEITPPENAVYYIDNGCGGMGDGVGDILTAEEQNDLLNVKRENGEFIPYGVEYVPIIELSWFECGSIEEMGIDFWYTARNGYIHIVVIDWYDENYQLIEREYIYATYGEYVNEEETEAVEEENLGKIEAPTPVLGKNDANWKLTTNHYPQTKENENVSAYYFQLEGDENTPDGKKVVYLPYSFIDPELDYDKAVEMKLEPKIHHYTDDHSELVEGKPIDGELRPEGIRFEVESFSPFVLAWEKENHEFGETAYEWSEDGKNCEAKRVCLVCEDHTETVKASVSGKKVKEPTCTEKGQTEYTAVFEAHWAEDQKKTVSDIPETGHDWNKPAYEWSEDGKNCEAKRICKNDEDHTETVKDSVSGKKVKEPTCTEKGWTEYTAVFEADWAEDQKKIASDIPETGHRWDKGEIVEEPTCTEEGTRLHTCLNDKNHTKEEDIPVDRDAHSFGKWKTVIKATEDREGKRVKICSECGKKVYEIIPMKDGNAIIISGTEREEDEENPNTGAAVFSAAALVSVIGAAGVFLLGKKR